MTEPSSFQSRQKSKRPKIFCDYTVPVLNSINKASIIIYHTCARVSTDHTTVHAVISVNRQPSTPTVRASHVQACSDIICSSYLILTCAMCRVLVVKKASFGRHPFLANITYKQFLLVISKHRIPGTTGRVHFVKEYVAASSEVGFDE